MAFALGWPESKGREIMQALLERRLVRQEGEIYCPLTIA